MSESSEPTANPDRRSNEGDADPKEHPKGSLDPAPVEPTTDDSGTGSAHKNSSENPDEPTSTGRGKPGDSGRETDG
jgi:hypothetical protein